MPKIPDYTALPHDIPQVSGDIDVRGVGETIAPGLISIARITADIHQRKNRNILAKANADMAVDLIAESNALDQDPDYATHDERFTGVVETKLGEHAATITDSGLREQFVQNYRPKIAAAREKVKDKAWGKERDFERGELITRLETLRNGAIISGEIGDANLAANELIQSHSDLAHIDADDAVKIRNSFRDDLSTGYIKAQDPEKRAEILKQPWAKKHLAPDTFAVIKREADEELRIGKAQTQVDEYLEKGMGRAEAMEKIDKKYSKDPELRKVVETRFDYAFNKQEKAIVEEQSKWFDEYFLDIRSGEATVDAIPREILEIMSPAQQNSLYKAQAASVSGTKVGYNLKVEDRLNVLIAEKKWVEARQYFEANAALISDAQHKLWSKITVDGVSEKDLDSPFSISQTIKNKAPKMSDTNRADLSEEYLTWHYSYQLKEGKEPADNVRDQKIDGLLTEYSTSWYGSDPLYKMTEEERAETVIGFKEASEKAIAEGGDGGSYKKIIDWARARGKTLTNIEMIESMQLLEGGQ